MRALINLLLNSPWWVSVAAVAGLIVLVYVGGWYIRRRFDRIVHEAVLEAGASLRDAQVAVHSATAVPLPAEHSPYDIDRDDENFAEGIDDEPWDEDGVSYYAIDATITPAFPGSEWDPTGLSLVPADYAPGDPTELTEKICPLHSAEIFANGGFRPAAERDVQGAQRIKLVFAVHDGLRAVKFALFVTYFGRVDLPAPLPKTPKPSQAAFKR